MAITQISINVGMLKEIKAYTNKEDIVIELWENGSFVCPIEINKEEWKELISFLNWHMNK